MRIDTFNEPEKEPTHDESLLIIRKMITAARENVTDNGAGWLLWGSMIFLACLGTFFLIEFDVQPTFLAWNIFGAFALVGLTIQFFRPVKKRAQTYVEDVLKHVDRAFIICLFIVILSMNVSVSPNNGFGFLLMIYGFLMLVQGGALRFAPLVTGAVVNWAGAIGIFFCTSFQYDMLISAAAVFIGYIIPGLLLRKKYKKSNL